MRRIEKSEFRLIRANNHLLSDRSGPSGFDLMGYLDAAAKEVNAVEAFVGYVDGSPVAQELAILTAEGVIPFASVRTLFTTPVQVIAAPGAGLWVEVLDCYWFLDFGTAAYDGAAAGDTLQLRYTNASGAIVTQTLAGNTIGAAAADYHARVGPADGYQIAANAPVMAHIAAGEWFVAGGDSPLKYRVRYRIRNLQT